MWRGEGVGRGVVPGGVKRNRFVSSGGDGRKVEGRIKNVEADGGSRLDIDGHADPGQAEQVLGVPIGQAEAAVGFGAADQLGAGGAVDAVAGFVQANPGDADRVVRAGGQDQLGL